MSKSKLSMSWGDRFALLDHFKPSDTQACTAFRVTQDELDTARTLRSHGTFAATQNMAVVKHRNLFSALPIEPSLNPQRGIIMTDSIKPTAATTHSMPETASKIVKEPKKRGRKGDKILKALQSVTTNPVAVDKFIASHGVSLAVLRQAKRFITQFDDASQRAIGKINVKQNKETHVLMIWRDDV